MKRRLLGIFLVVLLVTFVGADAFGTTETTLEGVTIGTTAAGTTQVTVTTSGEAFTVGGGGQSSLYETGSTTPIYTSGAGIAGLANDSSGNLYLIQGTEVNEITSPGTSTQTVIPLLTNWWDPNPLLGTSDAWGDGAVVDPSGNLIFASETSPADLYMLSTTCTVGDCPYRAQPVTNVVSSNPSLPLTIAPGWSLWQIPEMQQFTQFDEMVAGLSMSGGDLLVGVGGNELTSQVFEFTPSGSQTLLFNGDVASAPALLAIDPYGNLLIASGDPMAPHLDIVVLPTSSEIGCTANCPYDIFGATAGTVLYFYNFPTDGLTLVQNIRSTLVPRARSSLNLLGFSPKGKSLYVNDSGSIDTVAMNQFLDPRLKLKRMTAKRRGAEITVTLSPKVANWPVTLRVKGLNRNKKLAWNTLGTTQTNSRGAVTFRYAGHGVVDVVAKGYGYPLVSPNLTYVPT